MKSWILFIFFISTAALAKESIPAWLVRVEKTIGLHQRITGTGYVVQRAGKKYIRTASHLTLGQISGVKVFNNKGKVISLNESSFRSNNMDDDCIVELATNETPPLAVYSKSLDLYVITPKAIKELVGHKRQVQLSQEKSNGPSFISPHWVSRSEFSFQSLPRHPWLAVYDFTSPEIEPRALRNALDPNVLISNQRIIPGESGSPVINWSDIYSTSFQAIAERIHLEEEITKGLVDENHFPIQLALDSKKRFAYLAGHVISYHRYFPFSQFTSSSVFSKIDETELRNQDISSTRWILSEAGTSRVFEKDFLRVEEIFSSQGVAGNGTGGDGGNGTGGDGGNGTGGDGGNGTGGDGGNSLNSKSPIRIGMSFNGEHIITFQLKPLRDQNVALGHVLNPFLNKLTFLKATWSNFTLLRSLEILNGKELYTKVKSTNLKVHSYLNNRFQHSAQKINSKQVQCWLSEKNEMLKVTMKFESKSGLKEFVRSYPLSNFPSLEKIPYDNKALLELDYSGLFGADPHEISETYSARFIDLPYITLQIPGYRREKYFCTH